jgi:branched-chain amino acid transport system ATP-binding protein
MTQENSQANSQALLVTDQLQVLYGKVEALQATNIRVERGQIVTVIGPNGAGKSTMLNGIAGALPASGSQRGQVLLMDRIYAASA